MAVMEKSSNEKRLVDANKLIDFIDVGHLRQPGELCWSELDVANLLLNAPTINAAEVVRCRECKSWHEETGFCEIHSYFVDADGVCCSPADSPNWTMFDPDDFCSYGERKEGAD